MTQPIHQQMFHPHADLSLTLREAGKGSAFLVLHAEVGPASITSIIDHFALDHHVLAPTHPG